MPPSLGLRVGTEVPIAWAAARGAAGSNGRGAPYDGAGRAPKPPGRGPGGPPGRGSAGPAIFARARFADRERPAVEHLTVELLNRLFGVRAVEKLDERKTARPTGLAVDRQHDVRRRRDGAEVRAQVGFSGGVGQVADEEADSQSSLP